jgi:hypothetical protein
MALSAKDFYVALGTAASETNISTYLSSADFERLVDVLETTKFGSGSHTRIPGLKDSTFSADYEWDATIDGILNTNYAVAGKSLIVGPEGSATGKVKYSVLGFLSKYGATGAVDGEVTHGLEFITSGDVTRGVF